jgi:hypothetical protein
MKSYAFHFWVLIIFIVVFQIFHILLAGPRYYFDMLYYISTADTIFHAMREFMSDPQKFLNLFQTLQTGLRPTLYYVPGELTNLLFRTFNIKIFLVGTYIGFLIPLVFFVDRIRKSTRESAQAMCAFFLFLTSPLVLVYARYPMVEYPLYVVTAVSTLLFLSSNFLRNSTYSYVFLVSVVIGMLIKFSFCFFILFPAGLLILGDSIKMARKTSIFYVVKHDMGRRLKQFIFFLLFLGIGIFIFSGPTFFIENFGHSIQTEVAAWWSYPYITLLDKIWWFFIVPTQIITLPVFILFWYGVVTWWRKILSPLVFIFFPLFCFAFFMQSKGARMIAPITFVVCLVASYGYTRIFRNASNRMKRVSAIGIVFFVVMNVLTSGFVPLDFAPAYEYPEGGNQEVYKGLTIQFVARGGFVKNINNWENILKELGNVISNNTSSGVPTVVFLYYTPQFPPALIYDISKVQPKEIIHELLWSQAQKFPVDVFTSPNVFFVEKTGRFTHWVENGSGLELEKNLRFLKRQFDNPNSPWRTKTTIIARVPLPDFSEAIVYKRENELTRDEKNSIFESYLMANPGNGMLADIAWRVADYYRVANDTEKMKTWLEWIENSNFDPRAARLISKSSKKELEDYKRTSYHLLYEK